MEKYKFGYARVSTKEQNEARQIESLKAQGIDERHIFIDKESGKNFDRAQYQAMISMLREGDEVYVHSLDRLGRNYEETKKQWEYIVNVAKAEIIVLDMPVLDTRKKNDLTGTMVTDIVLTVLTYVADKERQNILKRQKEGIALAKEKGVYKGRKPIKVDKRDFEAIYKEVENKERTNRYAMQKLGLKPNTYYNFVRDYKEKTGMWKEEK